MNYILSIFICFLLLGCDPSKRIQMKNNSGSDAEITWQIKEDSILKSPFYLSSSKELKFHLKTVKPYNEVMMTFGIGSWTPAVIKNCVDDLESLTIRWGTNEIRLTNEEDISKFLLARRKGFGRSKILILIN
jgi:hypothetical protein